MSENSCKITASDVADYILASVDESSGDNISNLKLQKLVYYAQGFHLAMHDGEPLFDDAIVAWEHGPVVPGIWRKYRDYGAKGLPAPDEFEPSRFDPATIELLDEVNEVYGQFSPWKLRDMTHEELPWKLTEINCEIPRELMRDFFRTLLVDGQKQT
jgi:uncharacterized phage-associated protein